MRPHPLLALRRMPMPRESFADRWATLRRRWRLMLRLSISTAAAFVARLVAQKGISNE